MIINRILEEIIFSYYWVFFWFFIGGVEWVADYDFFIVGEFGNLEVGDEFVVRLVYLFFVCL